MGTRDGKAISPSSRGVSKESEPGYPQTDQPKQGPRTDSTSSRRQEAPSYLERFAVHNSIAKNMVMAPPSQRRGTSLKRIQWSPTVNRKPMATSVMWRAPAVDRRFPGSDNRIAHVNEL